MIHPMNINMWLGIGIELAVLSMLMGGLMLYQRWRPLSPEASRKLFHIGGGLTTLTFPWVFASAWPVVLLALVTAPSLLAVKYIRAFKGNLGSVLYRVDRTSFGEIYFPLSVCLLFVFARGNAALFLIPVLILTLADPTAAVIGCRYGRLRYTLIRGDKSVEGSAAFCLVAFPCTLLPLLLLTTTGLIAAVLIAILVGLLVMLAEAVSWEGLDNLFIPICSCLLLAGLLHLNMPLLFLNLVLALCLLYVILKICHRGPIYRVLSRFSVDLPPDTNRARQQRKLRTCRWKNTRTAPAQAPAEAGQSTLKRPSIAGSYRRVVVIPGSCEKAVVNEEQS